MSDASVFRQKAEMFGQRAEQADDPISRQHYREMAGAHAQSFPRLRAGGKPLYGFPGMR
jgi:hypothetical protein